MEAIRDYQTARNDFTQWANQLKSCLLQPQSSLMHTFQYNFPDEPAFIEQLSDFANTVASHLEPAVMENNLDANLPRIEQYNAIGLREDEVIHHPSYEKAGNIIYASGLMKYLLTPGQMKKTLSLFLLSSHAGEAGHNCPIACSAGIIRVLSRYGNLPQKEHYLQRLTYPSFTENYTGAQFLTEIQGGSDVGANATKAIKGSDNQWRIVGEKWFCSNANAELILLTARYDENIPGTKGLGLFLVPKYDSEGNRNSYKIKRLKQKIGTRSMATGEIDFEGALVYPMGEVGEGIHLVMENVLHLSRVFNAFSVLGMARRAYQTAYYYACHRSAFNNKIIDFPLVKEALAAIKADNLAMIASIFHMVRCQDELDSIPMNEQSRPQQLLLRTLANLNKYFTAKRSVENIHHCLDILAGNGTIESFSSLPRLLRDCLVCENWEGTHFTLWMQTLRDINRLKVDELFVGHISELLEQIENNKLLQNSLEELRAQFKVLKTLNEEEQSLHIRVIIEHMAILLAASTLAIECQDSRAPVDKRSALVLFIARYLDSSKAHDNYLGLLDKVIG